MHVETSKRGRNCLSNHAGHLIIMAAAASALLAKSGSASAALLQEPIGVTGFNGDTIVDAAATSATVTGQSGGVFISSTHVELSDINNPGTGTYLNTGYVHNGEIWYENGFVGTGGALTNGLPAPVAGVASITSHFTNSVTGGNTVFDYGYNGTTSDYADANTLYFAAATPQTLNLVASMQGEYASLDFLTAAEAPNVAGDHSLFDVTLNFADLTSYTYVQGITTGGLGDVGGAAQANYAIKSLSGTDNGNTGSGHGSVGGGWYMLETDLAVPLAYQTETIDSITFTPDTTGADTLFTSSGANDPAGIYAISGQAIVPEPMSIGTLLCVSGLALLRRRSPVTKA